MSFLNPRRTKPVLLPVPQGLRLPRLAPPSHGTLPLSDSRDQSPSTFKETNSFSFAGSKPGPLGSLSHPSLKDLSEPTAQRMIP